MTRSRLESALKYFVPRERLDAAVSDRTLAVRLLAGLGVDVSSTRGSDGNPIRERSDAYLIEYACLTAERARIDGAGEVDFNERQRRMRADQQRNLAQISRAPLQRLNDPPWTEEERKRPEWQRPLPNSREMQDRKR